MLPLVKEPWFDNFPIIFRLLTPLMRLAPSKLRPNLLAVLDVLVQRSPKERAYFFRQNLQAPDNTDTAWITRQVLKGFSPDLQAFLRSAMKQQE